MAIKKLQYLSTRRSYTNKCVYA